jgi:hypothetical protein
MLIDSRDLQNGFAAKDDCESVVDRGKPSNVSVEAVEPLGGRVRRMPKDKGFYTLSCGILFHKNAKGELPDIPWSSLVDEYYNSKVGGRLETEQRRPWVVGDIALYIAEMIKTGRWVRARLDEFVEMVQYKDPTQVKKLMSISRKFGWPDNIETQRRTPPLSHSHHIAVMGEGTKERIRLLDIAIRESLTVDELRRRRR